MPRLRATYGPLVHRPDTAHNTHSSPLYRAARPSEARTKQTARHPPPPHVGVKIIVATGCRILRSTDAHRRMRSTLHRHAAASTGWNGTGWPLWRVRRHCATCGVPSCGVVSIIRSPSRRRFHDWLPALETRSRASTTQLAHAHGDLGPSLSPTASALLPQRGHWHITMSPAGCISHNCELT